MTLHPARHKGGPGEINPSLKSPLKPALPSPLPRCYGPKLHPFGAGEADIEFITPLGEQTNKHSYVWKVRIAGKLYALKMFKFFPVSQLWNTSDDPSDWDGFTRDDFLNCLDPFNCECRAYGQLIANGREDVAVRALGYLLLTDAQERYLSRYYQEERGGDDHADIWNHTDLDRGQPVRAIVKELVEGEEAFCIEPRAMPKMFRDLTDLHEMGILVRDLHDDNYLQNRLVDLSMAWTMPHKLLERMEWHYFLDERTKDVVEFYDMIEYWNQEHEDDQIEEPPGFREYVNWGSKSLGKRPCHPLDLVWKERWDGLKSGS